jgi:hypothetical protein
VTVIDPAHRVLLIRLTTSFPDRVDNSASFRMALYDATSKWWKISATRTLPGPGAPEYAFAVHQGTVHAVYAIGQWRRSPDGKRLGFSGAESEELGQQYLGQDVSNYFPKGAVNPLRFVNCSTVPATDRTPEELQLPPVQSEKQRVDEIENLARAIAAEPLAHIMYGHRELFHSNMLAWFAKAMYREASDVFEALYTEPSDPKRPGPGYMARSEREVHNLDVVLHWDDARRPMVIENKLFSLPDTTQLDRYAKTLNRDEVLKGARQILLSLHDPGWDEDTYDTANRVPGGSAWHRVSYGTLSTEILKAVPESDRSYESETIRRYAKLVGNLQTLVDLVLVKSHDELVALPDVLQIVFPDRRLLNSLSKLRARSIAQIIQAECGSLSSTMEVGSGFSNGTTNISGFHYLEDSRDKGITVGWQAQGDDYRLFAVLPRLAGRSTAKMQARIDWANNHLEYFNFKAVDLALGTPDAPVWPKTSDKRPSGFNRFNPSFIYRSKKVPDLTVGQLIRAARLYAIAFKPGTPGHMRPLGWNSDQVGE